MILPKKETPICDTVRPNRARYDSKKVSIKPWHTAPNMVPVRASNTPGSESISFREVRDDWESGDDSEVVDESKMSDPTSLGNLQIVITPTTRQSPPLNSNGKIKSPA